MIDLWNKIVERFSLPKFVDHWRYTVLAAFVTIVPLSLSGCSFLQATTDSLLSDSKKVNQFQLDAEIEAAKTDFDRRARELQADVEAFKKRADMAQAEIERNQARIDNIVAGVGNLVQTYVPAPYGGVIIGVLSTLGLGLAVDNRRKDATIKTVKKK